MNRDKKTSTATTGAATTLSDRTLFEGIMDGNEAELALMLQAFLELMSNHHQHLEPRIGPIYRTLIELLRDMATADVPWLDNDDDPQQPQQPARVNPDGKALRAVIMYTAKATLFQALIHCVSIQRRYVTGKPYGPGVGAHLAIKAHTDPQIRWDAYRPELEPVVEALVKYVQDYEEILVANVHDTMAIAFKCRYAVLPDLCHRYDPEGENLTHT
jgi:hypothetical protein